MKNIKNHFGIKQTLTLALVVSMLVQTFIGVMPAFADHGGEEPHPIPSSASVVILPTTVETGGVVNANLTVNLNGPDKWRSTGWFIGKSEPNDPNLSQYTCVDTTNHESSGSYTESFPITVNMAADNYNIYFLVSKNDGIGCRGNKVDLIHTPIAAITVNPITTFAILNVVANPIAGGTVGIDGAIVATKTYNTTISSQHYAATYTENAGYTFTGWSSAGCPSGDFVIGSTETKTCTANFAVKSYTITFNSAGGSFVAPITQNYGTAVTTPANPTRTGHIFVGWSSPVPATMPANNLTLTAQWTPGSYTIYFDEAGGSIVADITADFGTTVTAPAAPTRTGYTFAGWDKTIPAIMPAYNQTIMAKWTINSYKITFNSNGGSAVASITQNYGTAITVPVDPAWADGSYKFAGWDKVIPSTMPDYNQTINAQWEERYVLTFNGNGKDSGAAPMMADYYDKNESVIVPANNPTDPYVKAGYKFTGWNTKADGSGDSYAPGSNIIMVGYTILYAQWEKSQYTIDFVENGGSAVADITADFGAPVTAPANPTRLGYTFTGWDKTIPATMPAEDMTITAQWKINSYTITFNSNGGTPIGSKTQDYGTAITAPAAPTRTGYTFAGWSSPIPTTMPAYSQTILAQWTVNNYSIFFDEAGGSTVPDITQAYGSVVTSPAGPTRTGYVFAGWLPIVPVTMPAYNSTLTAQWANLLVTVTYVAGNGGTVKGASTQIINYGDDTTEVTATPSTGYVFDSWSDGITTATRSDLGVTASKTVTANFKTSGEVKGATTTDESEVAGATDNANCACWCSCHLFLGISWCWWILIIIIALAIIIWRVIVAYERRREEE